jgi:hypothetical protein
MYRKFKSGYFHNNNIKYNQFEYKKTKMIKMELDENNKLRKVSSKNIYNVSVSHEKAKELAHRDNLYKLTDCDYYYCDNYCDYNDYNYNYDYE